MEANETLISDLELQLIKDNDAATLHGLVPDAIARSYRALNADNGIAALTWATLALQDVETLTTAAVQQARATGHTWAEIADALGITRQSAHAKFRHIDKK